MSTNPRAKKDVPVEKKDLPIGREHVRCDGPGCEKLGPPHRCSRCRSSFYCSVKCQREDWKRGHKDYCRNIKQIYMDEVKLLESRLSAQCNVVPSSNASCAICLRDDMVDPFSLPGCGHTFCFLCLQNWQDTTYLNVTWNPNGLEMLELTCPTCRAITPDIMMSVLDEVHLHMARAEVHIAEKRKHFELALERLDSLEQIGNFEKNKQGKMTILSSRGDVLINLERWAEALVVCEECQTLCEEGIQNRVVLLKRIDDHEKALNEGRHTDAEEIFLEIKKKKAGGMIFCKPDIDQMRILRDIAICKAETGDYDGALEVYIFKITAVGREARSLQNEKEMEREDFYHMMGMAMCFYHLEDYENAADAGARALLFDRRYRQVHKYAALSMRALGEIEDAIKIIASAISYEAPHDEENRKINIELYQELVRDASTGQ